MCMCLYKVTVSLQHVCVYVSLRVFNICVFVSLQHVCVYVSPASVGTQKVAALSLYSVQEAFQFQIWQNNVMLSDVRKKPPDDGVKSEDGK